MFAGLRRVLLAPVAVRRVSQKTVAPPTVLQHLKRIQDENPNNLLDVCRDRMMDMNARDCVHALMMLELHDRRSRPDVDSEPGRLLLLSQQAEVVQAIAKAAENCSHLRIDQFANFLILLAESYVCDSQVVAQQLTDHARTIASQFNVEDAVDLCTSVRDSEHFTELARILAESVLQRFDEVTEPAETLVELWECAVHKDMALLNVIQRIVEVLNEKSVVLTPDQLSSIVVGCRHLPKPICAQVLNLLQLYVIKCLSSETPGSTLADIVAMYSISHASADRAFWARLLPRLLPTLPSCKPVDLAKAAYGIASCTHLEKVERGAFLARIATPAAAKMNAFEMDEMAQLMEAFVKANCSHKVLFYATRRVLSRHIHYGDTALEVPRVLFSLARLQQTNRDFLNTCMEKMAASNIDQIPSPNISLMLYVMSNADLVFKDTPKGLLHGLVGATIYKWKTIPDDDFKVIIGCLNRMGFVGAELERHIVMRLSNDAAKTLAIMHRWAKRAENEKWDKIRELVVKNQGFGQAIKKVKRAVNQREDARVDSYLAQVAMTGADVKVSDGVSPEDIRDGDFINKFYPTDFDSLKWFKQQAKLKKEPVNFNQNELPFGNIGPSMLNRVHYNSNLSSE